MADLEVANMEVANVEAANVEAANIASLYRTLDQQLGALLRGASLECLVCSEFVMHARGGTVFCPECGSQLGGEDLAEAGLHFTVQAG